MKHLGTVSSEGGPLLFADAQAVRGWQGAGDDEDSIEASDYGRACALWPSTGDATEGFEIAFDGGAGVLWEMESTGTADIYADGEGQIRLVHAWINPTDNNEQDDATVLALAELPPQNPARFGTVAISSGILAVLWAPEGGQCVLPEDIATLVAGTELSAEPTGEIAIDGAALLVRLPPGHYDCWHDKVENAQGESARRCHLVPAGSDPTGGQTRLPLAEK